MKSIFLPFLFILFFGLNGFSQSMKITGTVYDTAGVTILDKASIMAVRLKDSVLLGFTRTNENGAFELTGFAPDTFNLVIEYPGLDQKSYFIFGNSENAEIDIPIVKMNPISQQLEEVLIIANKNAIYFIGDTLRYVADSFNVAENAVVEDLLKKLPGIKVEDDGSITSQGQNIDQVLVDGDEFFGSDPTIATRNLGAKGVESVDVYEKDREGASIGDDDKIQVMDLKLKDEAKKGYFGKVTGASDFALFEDNAFYEGEFLYNNFNKKRKISVFALTSNTPKSNFGFGDAAKFGLDNERSGSWWDQSNSANTSGIPRTLKTGMYYSDKIGKTGKVNVNYSYYESQLDAVSESQSSYFLADTSYRTEDDVDLNQRTKSHRINLAYKTKLDSLTSIEIKPSFRFDAAIDSSNTRNRFFGEDNNESLQTNIFNANDSKGFSSESEFRIIRKFKKPKRELKAEYYLRTSDNETESSLENTSNYYLPITDSLIQQDKTNENQSLNQSGILTYTEPISKYIKLQVEYLYQNNKSTQEIFAKDRLNNNVPIDDLSNNFDNIRIQNRGTAILSYKNFKHTFQAGIGYRNIMIDNTNLITDSLITQNINNLLPQFRYQFKPSQGTRLNIRYNTKSDQPSINNLQPVQDNTNPNAIQIGNPDLKPNYVHSLNIGFNTWKALSGRYIWSGIRATYTDNAFANSTSYDDYGRTISQTRNVDGNIFGTLFAGAGFPILNRKIEFEPNVNANYSKYTNFINDVENVTQNTSISGGLGIQFNLDSLEINIGNNYSYVNPVSSLSQFSNQPYSTQSYTAEGEWRIKRGFKIKVDANYTINKGRSNGFDQNIFVINAELSKAFLKTENLILAVNANDILNQNRNLLRQVNANVITDNLTTIISRYFLLRLTYKFNNNNTKEDDYKHWG
ncbi:TonB-dependent receptor family protein [Crocinitomicaceae bacterium]|nr:TonB-dependent receptor family protein [Crocinitomicaceae bacterium]